MFYVSFPDKDGKRWMMSAGFSSQPKPTVGVPRVLFEFPGAPGWAASRPYDVFPDGNRFLMYRPSPTSPPPAATEITIVDHWFEELKEKAPIDR